jgi:hypothetical protein
MKKSELKSFIKEEILSSLKEGVWSVMPERIPEFIAAIEQIKDEFHAVVGSDDVYDGLDRAVQAARDLMAMNRNMAEGKVENITKIGGYLANYLRFPLKNVGIKDDLIILGKDTYKVKPISNNDFEIINVKTGKTVISKNELMNEANLDEASKEDVVNQMNLNKELAKTVQLSKQAGLSEAEDEDEFDAPDKEPSKAELKKTKGLAKAKDELALLVKDMKSLARKYKEAEGAAKEKIVADLKKKTALKKELESIVNKAL